MRGNLKGGRLGQNNINGEWVGILPMAEKSWQMLGKGYEVQSYARTKETQEKRNGARRPVFRNCRYKKVECKGQGEDCQCTCYVKCQDGWQVKHSCRKTHDCPEWLEECLP